MPKKFNHFISASSTKNQNNISNKEVNLPVCVVLKEKQAYQWF